jgi:hypothetical protein
LVAFEKYGRTILPHGAEWKHTFQRLMIPFIRPEIFPHNLLPLLARHFKNPKASSDTDATLALALKQFDERNTEKNYIFEIPYGSQFRIDNGKVFKKIALRVKRYEWSSEFFCTRWMVARRLCERRRMGIDRETYL